jgi:hypothetical protein
VGEVVVVVGVVEVPELELVPPFDDGAGATVPCGSRSSVYLVPSAVFISVTGLLTDRVIVAWPVAYEPPAIETFALVAVSEESTKIGFDAGKSAPVVTDSSVPFTERTAVVAGGDGGAGGVFGVVAEPPPPEPELELDEPEPEPEPEPEDDELDADGPSLANGSLLEKRENDSSWPGSAGGVTTATSDDESVGAAVAAVGVPARVGAAVAVDVGAAAGVVGVVAVDPAGAATGLAPPPLCIPMSVFAAYAIASTSTTASRMTIFFCFACFALAASAICFLATACSFRAD